jgi:hypothetical protein
VTIVVRARFGCQVWERYHSFPFYVRVMVAVKPASGNPLRVNASSCAMLENRGQLQIAAMHPQAHLF